MRFWTGVAAMAWLAIFAAGSARAECPGRIVTLGGDVTEIVFALGAGDCVVADDTTSDYPAAAKNLPKVGYLRALNAEGVLALRPELILGSEDAGPPQVIGQLRNAGVRVELAPAAHTAAGVLDKIRVVARALGRPAAGARLRDKVRAQVCRVKQQVANLDSRVKVLFLLTVASGSPMAAGRDTAAAGIIELAGGINAVQAFTGYKPLNAESLIKLAPDVILLMSQGLDAYGGKQGILAVPGVALTPAGRAHRIIAMDGTFLLGFGPRVGAAAEALALKLYPQLAIANVRHCR